MLKKRGRYDIIYKLNNVSLIKSGGGTGPAKPRQPADTCKVLIPEDERKKSSGALEDFFNERILK